MEVYSFWALVKVNKDFTNIEETTNTDNTRWSAHKTRLLETMTIDAIMGAIGAGEYTRWLLGLEAPVDDGESVDVELPGTDLGCEGIFDQEHPPIFNKNGDELMCLETAKIRDGILKKLGNSNHKPLNKNVLSDWFMKWRELLSDIGAEHQKQTQKERQMEKQIWMAVDYFITESGKRRK